MIYLSGQISAAVDGAVPGLGVLVTPWASRVLDLTRAPWAADTGCFTRPADYTEAGYIAFLKARRHALATCLFCTAPDVVGDAEATWHRSRRVLRLIRILGFPAALVAQDGIELAPWQWEAFDVLFLGGSTHWKLSHHARDITCAALDRGKPVHMGRVNSYRRLLTAKMWGCASADGTLLAFGPDTNLPRIRWWLDELAAAPPLNLGGRRR